MPPSDEATTTAPAAQRANEDFVLTPFERLALPYIERARRMEATAKKAVTKFGISRDLLADYLAQDSASWEELEGVTEDVARDILLSRVWKPMMADRLPEPVSAVVFDVAVRRGVKEASKIVQRAVPKVESVVLKVDGKLREKSLDAIEKLKKAGKAVELAERIMHERTTMKFRLFDGKFLGRDVDLGSAAFAFARSALAYKTGIVI